MTGTLVKRVHDNLDLATEIIYKHRLFVSDDADYNREINANYISKDENEKSDKDDGQNEIASPTFSKDKSLTIFNKKPNLKHHRKLLNGNNPNMIYRAVDVCRTCYITYSLMQEYFDEIEKLISPKKSDWIHSEKNVATEGLPPQVAK